MSAQGRRAPAGAGLADMRARIAAVGGAPVLDSAPGQCTRISAAVPVRRVSPALG